MMAEVPAADAVFLSEVVGFAQTLYASLGRMEPSALIQSAPGALPGSAGNMLVLAIPQMGGSTAAKLEAMDIIRHHSIRLGSPRSAILAESWSIEIGENTEREIQELHRHGKGIGDHPDAFELVMIVIESDLGQTHAALQIDRRHKDMTILTLRDETTFVPKGQEPHQPMLFSHFHVPMADRISPRVIAWAKKMDALRGDPRDLAKKRSETKGDDPDLPTERTRH